jgi:hypothetical protein
MPGRDRNFRASREQCTIGYVNVFRACFGMNAQQNTRPPYIFERENVTIVVDRERELEWIAWIGGNKRDCRICFVESVK